MPDYTPGPWKTRTNGQVVAGINTIANVMSGDPDARLIASAPALLEALEQIADPFLMPMGKPEAIATKRREIAEAALRAAKGESA